MTQVFMVLLLVFVLTSCTDDAPNQSASVQAEDNQSLNDPQIDKPTADKANSHMLSEHERLLQKAKETEKAMQEADEKRRQAIEDGG